MSARDDDGSAALMTVLRRLRMLLTALRQRTNPGDSVEPSSIADDDDDGDSLVSGRSCCGEYIGTVGWCSRIVHTWRSRFSCVTCVTSFGFSPTMSRYPRGRERRKRASAVSRDSNSWVSVAGIGELL